MDWLEGMHDEMDRQYEDDIEYDVIEVIRQTDTKPLIDEQYVRQPVVIRNVTNTPPGYWPSDFNTQDYFCSASGLVMEDCKTEVRIDIYLIKGKIYIQYGQEGHEYISGGELVRWFLDAYHFLRENSLGRVESLAWLVMTRYLEMRVNPA